MKQVIVMRTDLNMRRGKMVAQGAHASVAAVVHNLDDDRVQGWLADSFTKICVGVGSEEELLEVYDNALSSGLVAKLITDNGRTEFHGVPTNTCIAVGPDTPERIDLVTGHLKLL